MSKDLFSKQAAIYAAYRPTYPVALIEYILSFVNSRAVAWDCATGNGQAAVVLSSYFEKVFATDSSEKQLQQAQQKDNIVYSVSEAEHTTFADNTFDLITVAQAYHWFRFDAFEKEVKRVAKNDAVIALWGYNIPQCHDAHINQIIHHFYTATVGSYWDAERKFVDDYYTTVPFNFQTLPSKNFSIEVNWKRTDVIGYLNSWSSVQHFIKANGYNPAEEVTSLLTALWPSEKAIAFHFPVFMRIGRVIK